MSGILQIIKNKSVDRQLHKSETIEASKAPGFDNCIWYNIYNVLIFYIKVVFYTSTITIPINCS